MGFVDSVKGGGGKGEYLGSLHRHVGKLSEWVVHHHSLEVNGNNVGA